MEEKKEISLEIRPEVAKGTYSNLAIITHSHSEFIFAQRVHHRLRDNPSRPA